MYLFSYIVHLYSCDVPLESLLFKSRHRRPYHARVAGSEELREVGENVGGVAHLNLHKMI